LAPGELVPRCKASNIKKTNAPCDRRLCAESARIVARCKSREIQNKLQKSALTKRPECDVTLSIEEVWKSRKQKTLNSESKTTSKYFAAADIDKVTPKVPQPRRKPNIKCQSQDVENRIKNQVDVDELETERINSTSIVKVL